jgi:flagellar FliL protein
VRSYFSGKYQADLQPEHEARLKQDIREILNTRFLDKARIRIVLFNKLDVMEVY